MALKSKKLAKLSSITALGAGTLGVVAGTAQASSIISITPDASVGFSRGFGSFWYTSFLGVAALGLSAFTNYRSRGTRYQVNLWGSGVNFRLGDALPGKKWDDLAVQPVVGSITLGNRSIQYRTMTVVRSTPGGATYSSTTFQTVLNHSGKNGSLYKLFQFDNLGVTDFGWIELSQSVSDFRGPDVRVLGLAYDASGTQIAAGDTGAPEPTSFGLAGFGALALGATGLRRWRVARQAKA